jgi:hypothetical protein
MGPDDRAVRREVLAGEVRQAVIELTNDDPVRVTSIPEVVRRIGVTDSYLLCEALEVARSLGWMTVAAGMISLRESGRAPLDEERPRAPTPVRSRDATRAGSRRFGRAHGRRSTRPIRRASFQ